MQYIAIYYYNLHNCTLRYTIYSTHVLLLLFNVDEDHLLFFFSDVDIIVHSGSHETLL